MPKTVIIWVEDSLSLYVAGFTESLRALHNRSSEVLLTEVLRYQLVTAVHDEHTADIEFDVVLLLLVLKKVKGSSPRNEEQCSEFQLTFHRKVLKKKKTQ